jgi:hypothetical protein
LAKRGGAGTGVDQSIDRNRRSVARRVQPLGLVAPDWNVNTKGQQTLDEETLGKEVPAAMVTGWIIVIMPPTSIAPSSMVVTDCGTGSFASPSEAACVCHLLRTTHKQVFSLRILDYGAARDARSWTQLSRTHISMSFRSTRLC